MTTRMLIVLIAGLNASASYAQTSPGTAAIPDVGAESAECPVIVAGIVNMPEVIAQVGNAETLYHLSQGQIAEYDRWFVEMEAAREQGVHVADIDDLIAQGKANYEIELQVSEAALCYMNK